MRRPLARARAGALTRLLWYWRARVASPVVVGVQACLERCDPTTQAYLDAMRYGHGKTLRYYALLSTGDRRPLTGDEVAALRRGDSIFGRDA